METRGDIVPPLIALLRQEEGTKYFVYDDFNGRPIVPGSHVIGHPTVGTGRALDVNGISDVEVDILLSSDVTKILAQLDKALPWWRDLSMPRQLVLASMVFQLGIVGTLGFKQTIAALERGDYATVAKGMLASLWAKQTPARVSRLAAMMKAG